MTPTRYARAPRLRCRRGAGLEHHRRTGQRSTVRVEALGSAVDALRRRVTPAVVQSATVALFEWGKTGVTRPCAPAVNPGCLRHRIHLEISMGRHWRTLACTLLPMLAAAGGAQAQSYGYGYDDDRYGGREGSGIVRCESVKNRSNECRLDGRARMIRQLSGSPCVEGETWGQSRNGVWVTQGCRAEFVGEYRRGGGWGNGAAGAMAMATDGAAVRWSPAIPMGIARSTAMRASAAVCA
jgi:hypothetical protein